jgi:hypothetical protein
LDVPSVVSIGSSFRTCSVVAKDLNHQGIVALARVVNLFEQTSDFVVSLLSKGSIDFGLVREQLLLIG